MAAINGPTSGQVGAQGNGIDDQAQDTAKAKADAQKIRNVGKGVETGGKIAGTVLSAAGYSAAGGMVTEASGYAGDAANVSAGAYEASATGDSTALIGAVSSTATSTLSSSLDKQPSAFSAEGKAAAHTKDAERLTDRAVKADERSHQAAADASRLRESEDFQPGNKKHERLTNTAINQKERKDQLAAKAADHRAAAQSTTTHKYTKQSEQFQKKSDRLTERANDTSDDERKAKIQERSAQFAAKAQAADQKARS